MKLATLKDGSRDGQLVVVSRDLATAHYATGIANRLQQVLDDWGFFAPQLQDLSDDLNAGRARHAFPFEAAHCLAPLPRAFQCIEAVESRLDAASSGPSLCQVSGDALAGPQTDISVASAALDVDFGAGLAAITGDIARAAPPEQALDGIRLLLMANSVTLRTLQRQEQAASQGPFGSRPTTVFSPVAVTPDELGQAWQRGRVHLTLQIGWNGRKFGLCDAAQGMPFGFDELIARACRTRPVRAGSIVCSGALVAATGADGAAPGLRGYASIAAKRQAETARNPKNASAFLQAGDTVRMEMKGEKGSSLFGAIEQCLVVPEAGLLADRAFVAQ